MSKNDKAIVVGHASEAIGTAASIIDVIARAAADPTVNVDKLERILSIQQTILADQRRTSFMAALADLEAKMPQINKAGRITDRDGALRNKYAKLEDIDLAIRPLCAEYGFSFSFDSKAGGQATEYSCAMHHRDGHTEIKTLSLPLDTGAGRNAVQSAGSSISYAKRYLLSMHLHLVTREEDDDGAGGKGPVTAEQAATLRAELAGVKGDEARFLNWLASPSFEEIPAANYSRAMGFIAEKKRRA